MSPTSILLISFCHQFWNQNKAADGFLVQKIDAQNKEHPIPYIGNWKGKRITLLVGNSSGKETILQESRDIQQQLGAMHREVFRLVLPYIKAFDQYRDALIGKIDLLYGVGELDLIAYGDGVEVLQALFHNTVLSPARINRLYLFPNKKMNPVSRLFENCREGYIFFRSSEETFFNPDLPKNVQRINWTDARQDPSMPAQIGTLVSRHQLLDCPLPAESAYINFEGEENFEIMDQEGEESALMKTSMFALALILAFFRHSPESF